MFRPSIITATALCLLLGACGDDTATITSEEYQAFRDQPTACGVAAPDPAVEMSFSAPGAVDLPEGATLHTSCGDIVIEFYKDLAPATVNSFAFLSAQGYFDGTVSHRIIAGFVVQFGDPTATGHGSPGYRIPDELPASDYQYTRGVVAMANGGPNTGGSQFFIAFGDLALDPDYTVFGSVVSCLDVLDAIAAIPVGVNPETFEASHPLESVYIESITLNP
jgi:cyclophilin family peptidyl-prolyl cis-trans isomerase